MSELQNIIESSIKDLIENSISDDKLVIIETKHSKKVHFIPAKYRVLGGILQSMNIKFGNLIQEIVSRILAMNPNMEILSDYSGVSSNSFSLSVKSDQEIDEYITKCQTSGFSEVELADEYASLIAGIDQNERNESLDTLSFKHDVVLS